MRKLPILNWKNDQFWDDKISQLTSENFVDFQLLNNHFIHSFFVEKVITNCPIFPTKIFYSSIRKTTNFRLEKLPILSLEKLQISKWENFPTNK